jgi:hypothetical protein
MVTVRLANSGPAGPDFDPFSWQAASNPGERSLLRALVDCVDQSFQVRVQLGQVIPANIEDGVAGERQRSAWRHGRVLGEIAAGHVRRPQERIFSVGPAGVGHLVKRDIERFWAASVGGMFARNEIVFFCRGGRDAAVGFVLCGRALRRRESLRGTLRPAGKALRQHRLRGRKRRGYRKQSRDQKQIPHGIETV